jgi:crotonobetainyl-CoA:carnitine CoA-transferase CaiB-like acyl-CoA transferase
VVPPAAPPLTGVRVLELGSLIAGPLVGRMLADFGAEVIKAEPPQRGDPFREWGAHRYKGRSLWWPLMSRGKKLVTLDLHRAQGQELCRRLAAECDVLVENFRPGTLERWGLGPERLLSVNPRLVIGRVSGYGQTGPYSRRPGFASAGEAMGGLRHVNGYPDQPPPRIGISLGDSLAALFAVQGILMALYERDVHGGRGQVVDASIVESCFALLDSMVPEYGKLGVVRGPSGARLGHAAPSSVYLSRDGKWMVVAANTDNLWRRLCTLMERPDLLSDERFDSHQNRGRYADELDEIIGAWVAERDSGELDRVLNDAGIVCAPVYTIADIFADPHFRAREMLLEVETPGVGPLSMPGVVPKLSATPGGVRWAGGWELGTSNQEIYGELLGLAAEEVARLREAGAI